jgi:hypothetical protein
MLHQALQDTVNSILGGSVQDGDKNRHSWRVNEPSSNSVLEQGTTNQPKQGLSPLHLKRLLKIHTMPSRVVWKAMVPCAVSSRVFATHLCLGTQATHCQATAGVRQRYVGLQVTYGT